MCQYCGCGGYGGFGGYGGYGGYNPYYGHYPYTQYSPYQYSPASYGSPWGYPYIYDYGFPYYGFPLGYAYQAGNVGYGAAQYPRTRGEFKVGNCLMICQ